MTEVHFQTSGFLPTLELGPLIVPTYFLIVSIALSSAVVLLWLRSRKNGLSPLQAMNFSLLSLCSALVGARGFHVLFEEPRYYFEKPLRVLKFWYGGFTWHGGLIGGLIGLIIAARISAPRLNREQIETWLDTAAPVLAFGYAFGRVGCFLTGCCHGASCPWPGSEFDSFQLPSQLLTIVLEFMIGVSLLRLERHARLRSFGSGTLFWIWLALHAVNRLMMELIRGDDRGPSITIAAPPDFLWSLQLTWGFGFAAVALAISLYQLKLKWNKVLGAV